MELPVIVNGEPQQMSELGIVEYLTYCNYKHNRGLSPDVTPEQWAKVYGPSTTQFEARYQREKASSS